MLTDYKFLRDDQNYENNAIPLRIIHVIYERSFTDPECLITY